MEVERFLPGSVFQEGRFFKPIRLFKPKGPWMHEMINVRELVALQTIMVASLAREYS